MRKRVWVGSDLLGSGMHSNTHIHRYGDMDDVLRGRQIL